MPKKAKAPKMSKLSRMTEEERLLYMQEKQLEEDELKKRKEDMLAQFLKDKLSKEERNTHLNMWKLNEKWRAVMRRSKASELQKDIAILSQTFERVADRKNSIIRALIKDLAESEEQYAAHLRNHAQNVDRMINMQWERLQVLDDEFTSEVDTLKKEFESEGHEFSDLQETEMTNLEDITYAMDQMFGEIANEARQEFNSTKDDLKNRSLEEKHSLRVQLEGEVEDLWQQFQYVMKLYNEATEEQKSAFELLKERDEKSAKEIERQMKKLQRIQDTITLLRIKLAANARECQEKNKKLREEKATIKQHFQTQKNHMKQLQTNERERLMKLTLESNAALKTLGKICKQGEHVLKVAEMCRKLETEEEKILPFYASSLTSEDQDRVRNMMLRKTKEPFAMLDLDYMGLECFWKRYNKVQLEQMTLNQEKRVLQQENVHLRQLLKQYLDGISVNEEILSNLNSLIVINNKTMKMNVPVMETRVAKPVCNMIEAAHIFNHIP
ncbi:dynein regulatory complex subunit 2 [Callorhinchus milii]|uniref:Dynein regulatory complex subunit 2 n=1 Tax=Callorhinchus milii TaxID=7868 RepID=V9KTF1_CALMI|nr:dynein regulatory complex subunit 2 [Callorhinchus milii]XP_007910252.2 dynein regulatory complex subunit 2 [Callorhinchus milii]